MKSYPSLSVSKVFVIIVGFVGSSWALSTAMKPLAPFAQRMVEISFFVDNNQLLQEGILEMAFQEDHYLRRVVQMTQGESGSASQGNIKVAAPEGDLTAVVCGHVKCATNLETELVCGKSSIPSRLALDRVHQITFSTNRACGETPGADKFAQSNR